MGGAAGSRRAWRRRRRAGRHPGCTPAREAARRRWRLWAAGLATGAAAVLFAMPRYDLPDPGAVVLGVLPAGPAAHTALCAASAALWVWALPRIREALLVCLLFAGGAELAQALPFSDRTARLADFGFNLVGVALGLAAALLVRAGRTVWDRYRVHRRRRRLRRR